MPEFTKEKLAELRAVAERATEPDHYVCDCVEQCAGICPRPMPVFKPIDRRDVLALLDALEAKTAEVERITAQRDRVVNEAHERMDAIDARGDAAFIGRAEKAEAALERVKALHHDAGESQGYTPDVRGGYGMIPHCCASCGTFGEYGEQWPCATIQAIEGEQG